MALLVQVGEGVLFLFLGLLDDVVKFVRDRISVRFGFAQSAVGGLWGRCSGCVEIGDDGLNALCIGLQSGLDFADLDLELPGSFCDLGLQLGDLGEGLRQAVAPALSSGVPGVAALGGGEQNVLLVPAHFADQHLEFQGLELMVGETDQLGAHVSVQGEQAPSAERQLADDD